jgi:hypothetical protein
MARFTPSAGPPAAFHHVRADDHFISRMSSMKVVILLINKSSYVGAVLEELEIVCFEVEEGLCCETRPTRPTSIFGSWSWIGEDCIMHDNNKQCNRLFLLGKMLDWILEKMGILKGAVGWRGCKWHPQRILCSLDLSRCSFLDKRDDFLGVLHQVSLSLMTTTSAGSAFNSGPMYPVGGWIFGVFATRSPSSSETRSSRLGWEAVAFELRELGIAWPLGEQGGWKAKMN